MSNKEIKPRVTHFHERDNKRVITVAYKWHLDGKVEYGATVWNADKPGDVQTKQLRKQCTKTAMGRMEKRPVIFFVEAGKMTGVEVRTKIRKVINKLGVTGFLRVDDTGEYKPQIPTECVGDSYVEAFEKIYNLLEQPKQQLAMFDNWRWRFVSFEQKNDKFCYKVALQGPTDKAVKAVQRSLDKAVKVAQRSLDKAVQR